MPYEKTFDLAESVRHALPPHAEEIYKEAYNYAYEEYGHDESRAHRVAWGAVKRKYHKDESSGAWVERPSDA
jgi:cation transport regulator